MHVETESNAININNILVQSNTTQLMIFLRCISYIDFVQRHVSAVVMSLKMAHY